ncbi:aldo/keto reductase [bacterium]|nr:aldo/keto reductase [bacterium]
MSRLNRRQFIQTGAAVVGAGVLQGANAAQQKRTATDWVTLNQSGVKVTRLGMGTGSNSGRVQMQLGEKGFIRLVHYAYERGIRFFDTADGYGKGHMQSLLAKALKDYDRDTYVIQTKMKRKRNAFEEIERFRKEWDTDYFDILLLHYCIEPDWPDLLSQNMDRLGEAKNKQWIRSMGASIHGLKGLRAMTDTNWMDTALLRVNHNGTAMDNEENKWEVKADVDKCVDHIRTIHNKGTGVIGMKLIGNGNFKSRELREASIKYVMGLDCVDAVTIGFKSPQEIDEAIELMNKHLNT